MLAVRPGEPPRATQRGALQLHALHRVRVAAAIMHVRAHPHPRTRIRAARRVDMADRMLPPMSTEETLLALGAAARAAGGMQLRRRSGRVDSDSTGGRRPPTRPPTDGDDRRRPAPTPTGRRRHDRRPTRRRTGHDRRSRHDRPAGHDADTAPDTTAVEPSDDPFEWEEFDEGVEIGHASRCRSTTTTRRRAPSSCSSPATWRRIRTSGSAACSSTRADPGFGGSDFAIYADQIYSETLLEHFDIVGWDPRGTGLSEPAIDCIDDYDRYFASADITPDDDAERQQIVDLAEEFAARCASRTTPTSSPYVGTNNSARDMDAIRQALGEDADQLLRVQLRQRARRDVGDAVPRHRARRGARRRRRPERRLRSRAACSRSRGFEALDRHVPRAVQRRRRLRVPQRRRRRGRVRRADAADRREPDAAANPDRPDVTRGVALTGVAQAMYSEALWAELEQALADAQDGDGSGLLALYDQYYVRNPDGTYDNSLEAFQTISCMDDAGAPDGRGGGRRRLRCSTRPAPRFAPGTTGGVLLHVLPGARRPAGRDHRRRCRADPGRRHHRRPGDAAVEHGEHGRARSRRACCSWSRPTSTPATASTTAATTPSTATWSTSRCPECRLHLRRGLMPDERTCRSAMLDVRTIRWRKRTVWRKGWDSNPRRPRRPQQFSRLSHSSTLAPFRGGRLAVRCRGDRRVRRRSAAGAVAHAPRRRARRPRRPHGG